MVERLTVLLQHLLPKRHLTDLAGLIAKARGGAWTTRLIEWFVKRYDVDMGEAAQPDVDSYESFNAFFTRTLRPGLRPHALADYVCPVDGTISQVGAIDDYHLLQAKGHYYSTRDLLAGDDQLAGLFRHGDFANLYLSPKDYHRLHMPCRGILERMIYVPGTLFSVNPVTARGVPNLFARNERVICLFASEGHGPFAMVLVGATIVGSIATTWHGAVNATRAGRLTQWVYKDNPVTLDQGEEMGRFLLGSTVVLLFRKDAIVFDPGWRHEKSVRLGERMGDRPREIPITQSPSTFRV